MCGRFASTLAPDLLRQLFGTVNDPINTAPRWNLAPTQSAPVVRRHPVTGARHLDLLRWGLIPSWRRERGPEPINARAETAANSGLFRRAFRERRCLVPATAFYEWRQGSRPKQPFAIARADGAPLALAGLWESGTDPAGDRVRSFAILTTVANDLMRPIHDRMPVILEPEDWPAWLGETAGDPGALLRPAAPGVLRAWPVSDRVNAPRHDAPDLLDPVGGPAGGRDEAEAGPDSA